MKSALLVLALLPLSACQGTRTASERSSSPTNDARFDRFKGLAGDWEAVGASTAPGAKNSYRLTAGGSAVVETVFQGTAHEMVTVYHRDGDALVLTHYCSAGNAPTMRAVPDGDPLHVVFECTGGANMAESDGHMHHAEWTFTDANHATSRWTFIADGKAEDPYVMELERRPQG